MSADRLERNAPPLNGEGRAPESGRAKPKSSNRGFRSPGRFGRTTSGASPKAKYTNYVVHKQNTDVELVRRL